MQRRAHGFTLHEWRGHPLRVLLASPPSMAVKRPLKRLLSRPRLAPVRRAARSAYYLGWRVECPCCQGRFRRFVVLPEYEQTESECPRCGSYARHRLVWLYLTRRTDLSSGPLRLLHVAPSDPMYAERLRALPQIDYVSIDLEPGEAQLTMDVTALSFPDEHFDAIICSHVLEHVPDDRAAMRELRRVLRPGGWAVMQTPVDERRSQTYEDPSVQTPAARAAAFNQPDHVRVYGHDYAGRLREAGFTVERIAYVDELEAEQVRRHGLDPVEPIWLCRRAG